MQKCKLKTSPLIMGEMTFKQRNRPWLTSFGAVSLRVAPSSGQQLDYRNRAGGQKSSLHSWHHWFEEIHHIDFLSLDWWIPSGFLLWSGKSKKKDLNVGGNEKKIEGLKVSFQVQKNHKSRSGIISAAETLGTGGSGSPESTSEGKTCHRFSDSKDRKFCSSLTLVEILKRKWQKTLEMWPHNHCVWFCSVLVWSSLWQEADRLFGI